MNAYYGNYLITTDNWFYAPDGKMYRAAWGQVTVLEDNVLKIKTNRNSTNWYLQIGYGEKLMIIAGCQIHYAIKCPEKPNIGEVIDWASDATNGCKMFERPSVIYIAQ